MVCPQCKSKKCAKNGKNSANLQKYICKFCKFTFCPRGKFRHITKELKDSCLRLYLEGMGFRGIGRFLGISYGSAYNIVRKSGEKLKAEAEKVMPVEVVEMDEIHTYVAKKKLRLGVDRNRQARKKVHQFCAGGQVGKDVQKDMEKG